MTKDITSNLKIGIVYFSKTDVTHQLAEAIAKGAKSEQGELVFHRITNNDLTTDEFKNDELFAKLATCDAIAFGSPTYMGAPSAQFKAFADKTGEFWTEQQWADKLATGFTSGTGLNGDQSATLQYFMTLACQHGMLWVSVDKHDHSEDEFNRLNNQKGIIAHAPDGNLHLSDAATAEYMGARLARLAKQFKEKYDH